MSKKIMRLDATQTMPGGGKAPWRDEKQIEQLCEGLYKNVRRNISCLTTDKGCKPHNLFDG
jgi:hypothetical protein